MTKIDGLAFEIEGDQIMLEQDGGCGEVDRIAVHPIHLRYLAESLGLVSAVSASGEELLRDLSRYKRALLMIRERAAQLHNNIYGLSQLGHEEMGIEVAQSAALADFAEHICVEFEDDFIAELRPVSASTADNSGTEGGQKADKRTRAKGGAEQQALTLEQVQ